jgi:enoyl-[acyl-carrier-protein] reductase (NADH)
MGQIPDLKELIDAGFYLLQSRSVTGQIIYVDGGQHILGNGV